MEEANACSVYTEVRQALEKYEREESDKDASSQDNANRERPLRVGLHYTGGTKVMSVQAHRALEEWARERGVQALFSYLDARTLHMRFDPLPGSLALSFYVGRGVEMTLRDLLTLHNWELVKEPRTDPVLPESAAALLAVHSDPDEATKWTNWLHNELFPNTRIWDTLPAPFRVLQAGEELQGQYKVERPSSEDKWKRNPKLQNLTIPWPDLDALQKTMSTELGLGDAQALNLTAARTKGCKDEEAFCKWLSGEWLESAVLSVLQDCSQELQFTSCYMDLWQKIVGSPKESVLFQFDVVAIRGYQLFAFSCTTVDGERTGSRWLLKQKLFEAYERAQQMGGDEACTALVCCMEQSKADRLADEMRRDLRLEGRIRVFGREQLGNLSAYIKDWVRTQSKED